MSTEWYDDVATLGEAQTLSTAAGSSLTGIDAVLVDAGMVTGVITGPEGQPLQYAYAQAYDASGNFYASTFTQADGTYRLRGIAPAGNCIIRFRPPNSSGYAVEWYNDKNWSGEANAVAVVLREETPNINAQLGYGGTISGTVTAAVSGLPVANVTVVARDEANIGINSAVTNASGQYTIYRVPACNVKLNFNAGTTGYASEWYNDKADFATADLVPVAAGQNVTGINAQLQQASLTVTSPNGGETWSVGSSHDITWSSTGTIANVRIEYSTNNGSDWSDVIASTANTGTYAWTIPNVPSTTCSVRVSDAANAAVNDASDAVFTIVLSDDDIYEDNDTLATAATLTPGVYEGLVLRDEDYFKVYVEEGKDLQVSISGAALPPASVGDMDIELYDASGNLLVAAASDSTSEMLYLSNLAAGWYFIRNAWWDVAHNYTLTIASGDLPLGEISGRVTDIRGSGIANVWVMFYEPSGSWSLLRGYALTDSNGDYRFAYTAGDHKVQFSTTRPECTVVGSYVDEWYDDVATLGEAQTLSTAAGSSLTGIDAVLGDAGMVTGVITGPEGQPLQYAYAQAYDASGNFYASTFTQADGTYRLRGIAPAGNYIIRFRPPNSSGYAVEWYNDKSWSGEADAVAVVLREETPNINAQLGYGGTISGTVTAAVSGLPVANVTVVARDEANIGINSAVTNASGQYTIYRVPACNVKLNFNAGTTGYASEWYNDKADFATADLVPVAAGQNVTGINAQLLLASITVTSPNGGETWSVGSSHDITWTSTGTIADVKIEYSTDSGTSYTTVIASTANTGSYAWTVPGTLSTTCMVRVSDAADGDPLDASDAVFIITAPSNTISGTILVNGSPFAGVVMSGLPGDPTTNASGVYSGTVAYNWSGTVTPTLAGYTFSPANRTYTNVFSNQTSQDYTATAITYTISGNAGIAGATLNYTDGTPKTANADGSGNYSFTVSYNWSGTVTPSFTGYTFTPANRTYTNVLSNQTSQDYTATAITYTISGNAGIAGATLNYTDGTPKTATADGSGNYLFTVTYNWSGTVTPSLTGYNFSPTNRTYSNVLSNQTAQEYSAALITFTVTFIEGAGGTITGTKVQTVNYGANASAVTAVANAGYYFVNWTGGYTGTANPLTVTNVTADLTITANFVINDSVTVTAPNGGESWMVGSIHDITWSSTGTIANVNIDYSTNNGGNWASVAANTANDGTQPWTIPSTPSTTCLVRVRNGCGSPSDISNAVFTIAAAAETVSAPDEPTGPSTGLISTSYDYSTGGSTSSLGHSVQYKFDWDDGSDSGWLAAGTTTCLARLGGCRHLRRAGHGALRHP